MYVIGFYNHYFFSVLCRSGTCRGTHPQFGDEIPEILGWANVGAVQLHHKTPGVINVNDGSEVLKKTKETMKICKISSRDNKLV